MEWVEQLQRWGTIMDKWKYRKSLSPLEQTLLRQLLPALPERIRAHITQTIGLVGRFDRPNRNAILIGKPGAQWPKLHLPPLLEYPLRCARIRFEMACQARYEFYCLFYQTGFGGFEYLPESPPLSSHPTLVEPPELLVDFSELIQETAPIVLGGWLTEWAVPHAISDLEPPLTDEDRATLLRQRNLNLPSDYLAVVRLCEGFAGSDYAVVGLSQMWEVEVSNATWWVLAERGGAFIVAKEGDTEPRVYYIHHEEGVPTAEFTSFREAMEYLLAQPHLP